MKIRNGLAALLLVATIVGCRSNDQKAPLPDPERKGQEDNLRPGSGPYRMSPCTPGPCSTKPSEVCRGSVGTGTCNKTNTQCVVSCGG